MRVEYLIAWDDGTWTTEFFTVPEVEVCDPLGEPEEALLTAYAVKNLLPLTKYRKAVMFAVYSFPDEEKSVHVDAPKKKIKLTVVILDVMGRFPPTKGWTSQEMADAINKDFFDAQISDRVTAGSVASAMSWLRGAGSVHRSNQGRWVFGKGILPPVVRKRSPR